MADPADIPALITTSKDLAKAARAAVRAAEKAQAETEAELGKLRSDVAVLRAEVTHLREGRGITHRLIDLATASPVIQRAAAVGLVLLVAALALALSPALVTALPILGVSP